MPCPCTNTLLLLPATLANISWVLEPEFKGTWGALPSADESAFRNFCWEGRILFHATASGIRFPHLELYINTLKHKE
jgi:hypothetical protein